MASGSSAEGVPRADHTVTDTTLARKEKLHRRGLRLEWFTVAWNVVEAVVAMGAGALHKDYKRLQEAVVCSESNYHL